MIASDRERAVLTDFLTVCTGMLDALDTVEHRAKLFCATNPVGFFVWTGGSLPAYLTVLEGQRKKLRATIAQVNTRLEEGSGVQA